jgi:tetratricopeptide (TPR) repeat protein
MADIAASNHRYSNIEMCPSSGGGALVRILRKTTPPGLTPFKFISSSDVPPTLSAAPRQSDIENIQRIANESGALGVCQQQVDGGYGLFLRYADPELAMQIVGSFAMMSDPMSDSKDGWRELSLDPPPPTAAREQWQELDLDAPYDNNLLAHTSKTIPVEIQSAHRWTEMDPNNPEAWKALSKAYMKFERFGDAHVSAQFATIISPNDSTAHHLLGKVKLALGGKPLGLSPSENATSVLSKAVELDPESIEIRIDLARSLAANGDINASQVEFIELLDMAIEQNFRINDDTLFFFASSFYEARNYHTAIKALKRISVEFHSYSYSRFLIGVALIATDKHSQAVSALRHAANIVESPTYETSLGMALLLNGEYDQAIIHLGRTVNLYENNAPDELRFAICLAHIALKNSNAASDSLGEYVEALLKGTNRNTKELGHITTALIKQYPEWSTRVLRMAMKRAPNNEKLGRLLGLALLQTGEDETSQFAGFIDQAILNALYLGRSGRQMAILEADATPTLDPSQLLLIGGHRFGVPLISAGTQASSPTPRAR